MENKEITILGGTGNLGLPVLKNLNNLGFRITALVRDLEKAKKRFQDIPEIKIIEADLNNVESLKNALKDTAFLYLNLSTQTLNLNIEFATEREGVSNIVKAVNRDKIKQIIAISGLGAYDNVKVHRGEEFIPNVIRKQGHKILKSSGIPYTILHCSWFIDSFVIYRRSNVYAVIGNPNTPIYFTNCQDYSLHVANAIGNPDAFFKEFPVQGNIGIGHVEASNRFFKVFGGKTKVKVIPHFIIALMSFIKPEMRFLKHMSKYFSKAEETYIADICDTFRVLGTPRITIEEYAQKLIQDNTYKYLNIEN